MSARNRVGIFFTLFVLGLDQLTKWLIDRGMTLHESIPIIPGFLNLTYVRNTGVAFGLFSSPHSELRVVFLLGFSLVAIAVILILWIKSRKAHPLLTSAFGLILGGALGNLIDRLRYGEVVDFIDLHWQDLHWPAFNVADSAISVGVVLLLFHLIFWGESSSQSAAV